MYLIKMKLCHERYFTPLKYDVILGIPASAPIYHYVPDCTPYSQVAFWTPEALYSIKFPRLYAFFCKFFLKSIYHFLKERPSTSFGET